MVSEVIGPITGIFDRAVGTTAKVGAFYNKEQTQFPEAKSLGLIFPEVDGRGGPLLRVWCLDVSLMQIAWLG